MSRKLENYLLTHRKRAHLTQDEMAFLVGSGSGTTVSRYEHYTQRPRLEMVLAYEIVTGTPARELFAGLYDDLEQQIQKRSRQLAQRLKTCPPDRATETKLEFLKHGSKPTKPKTQGNV